MAAAFLPYAWIVAKVQLPSLHHLLAVAALLGLPMVFAAPVLSDDAYRFLWDARVLSDIGDPYAFAPDAPELAPLRDDLWAEINHPSIATIYPPLAQLWFWIASLIAHATWPLQLLALLAHLGCAALLHRVFGEASARVFALNPLALVESASSAHLDVLVGVSVLSMGIALSRGRAWMAAFAAIAASGLKLIGILLAPLIALRSRPIAAVALLLALLPIAPLFGAGGAEGRPGVAEYSRRWRGNDAGFAVLVMAADAALAPLEVEPSVVKVEWLEGLEGTPLDPRASMDPKKLGEDPRFIARDLLASSLARLSAALIVLFALIWVLRRDLPPLRALRVVLICALLFMPQVHPWYLLWVLPIEAALEKRAMIVWSALVLVAYAPLDAWVSERRWHQPALAALIEYGLLAAVLVWEHRARHRPEKSLKWG